MAKLLYLGKTFHFMAKLLPLEKTFLLHGWRLKL
jgi:hypothetical protein